MCAWIVNMKGGGVQAGFDANKSSGTEDDVTLFSISSAATVAHFHFALICNLSRMSVKVKGALSASSLVPVTGSEQQPPLGRPCPVSSAMPPPAPLHYVAFASYCLCIASARSASISPPITPLFTCPSTSPSLSLLIIPLFSATLGLA